MPIYDYRCEKCGESFSLKMTMTEHERQDVSCPRCTARGVAPVYGSFYAKTSKKS